MRENYQEYEIIFKEYINNHWNERNCQEYEIIFKEYANDHWNEKYKLKLLRIWKNIQEIYNQLSK